jgi:hypothetical protein
MKIIRWNNGHLFAKGKEKVTEIDMYIPFLLKKFLHHG